MPGATRRRGPRQADLSRLSPPRRRTDRPVATGSATKGAGHYVKMVHNGIEYGDMQLMARRNHLLSGLAGLGAPGFHDVFARWNKGRLDSYLIEITRDIFGYRDRKPASRWSI